MTNRYTRTSFNDAVVAQAYEAGEPIASIASRFKVHPRRIRQSLKIQGVVIRKPTDHMQGNQFNRKHNFDREFLDRLYTQEQKSISELVMITGCKNIRDHLIRYASPLRGFAETRIGKGDNLSPESRAKVAMASTGSNNWNWKGGVTEADKLFYYSKIWKILSVACKRRDKLTCQRCKEVMQLHKLRAHHIVSRYEGGPDELSNLITLCNSCHRLTHFELSGRAVVNRPNVSDAQSTA